MSTPEPAVPPPPPVRRNRSGPATVRLVIFTVRHVLGLAVFGWLTKTARDTDEQSSLWLVVAALLAGYLVAAVFGWWQLFDALQRAKRG